MPSFSGVAVLTAAFANKGQSDLTQMEEAMHNMGGASRSISGRLETINEKAENITNVVDTIAKVADQTNLPSLNAAIEAEKAGEYGRGFNTEALRESFSAIEQLNDATRGLQEEVSRFKVRGKT